MQRTCWLCLLYTAFVLLLPVAALLLSFPQALPQLPALLKDRTFLFSLSNSLQIAGAVSLLTLLLALPAAVLLAKTDLPASSLLLTLLTLPVFFVPYQFALAWSAALPPSADRLLFSKAGVIFILTGSFFPVTLWLTYTALSSIPPEEEETALMVVSPWKVIARISLPRAFPAAATGTLLVFLLAFSELGVATYLGVKVISYEVLVQFSAFYNTAAAIAASLPMFAVGLAVFLAELHFIKPALSFLQKSTPPRLVIKLRRKNLALLYPELLLLLFLLLPFSFLVRQALTAKEALPALSQAASGLARSLLYSSAAGLSATLWALFATRSSFSRLHSYSSLLTFLLPPSVVAVGLIYAWNRPAVAAFFYATAASLILAYLARFSFLSHKVMETAFSHLDPSAEEAALLSGASRWRIFSKITFPQLRHWALLSFMLVFIFSMNELAASSLLYPPGGEPLVVRLYTFSVNTPLSVCAILALAGSAVSLLVVLLLWFKGGKE